MAEGTTSNSSQNKNVDEWLSLLEEPINPTDPVVIFDPDLEKPNIVRKIDDDEVNSNSEFDHKKIDAIAVPLININGINLQSQQIEEFKLSFVKFVPELKLVVNDPRRSIQYVGGAGLSNNINVILTCPIDGMYKKISLPFYILDQPIYYILQIHHHDPLYI